MDALLNRKSMRDISRVHSDMAKRRATTSYATSRTLSKGCNPIWGSQQYTEIKKSAIDKYEGMNQCGNRRRGGWRVSTPNTIHHNRLTVCLPSWLSGSWPLHIDFVLVKRLWISWFLRLRFCGRFRNQEFTITIILHRLLVPYMRISSFSETG